MSETLELIVASEALARLAEFWADPQPARFSGRMPRRIAGGDWDQSTPEGTQNPYWEIVRQLPLDDIGTSWGRQRPEPTTHWFDVGDKMRLLTDRFALCATYSWAIPSPGAIAWITQRLSGRGIVEPGAGAGYWAWQLAQAGADVIAYEPSDPADNKFVSGPEWFPVLRDDHGAPAKHPDRSLLLCWPNYAEPWAEWSLATYKGDQLFYIGEGEGGCCADDGFFSLLEAEWEEVATCPSHVSFWAIHCYLTEYRRKGTDQPPTGEDR
jgi:hypothetical protein